MQYLKYFHFQYFHYQLIVVNMIIHNTNCLQSKWLVDNSFRSLFSKLWNIYCSKAKRFAAFLFFESLEYGQTKEAIWGQVEPNDPKPPKDSLKQTLEGASRPHLALHTGSPAVLEWTSRESGQQHSVLNLTPSSSKYKWCSCQSICGHFRLILALMHPVPEALKQSPQSSLIFFFLWLWCGLSPAEEHWTSWLLFHCKGPLAVRPPLFFTYSGLK